MPPARPRRIRSAARVGSRVGALLLVGSGMLAGAGSAQAGSAQAGSARAGSAGFADAKGDVVALDVSGYDEQFPPQTPVEAPATDIVRLDVDHTTRRVTLLLELDELRLAGAVVRQLVVTGEGRRFEVTTTRGGALTRLTRPGDGRPRCPGLRGRAVERTDLLRVSVPTTCLGSPRSVRVGATVTRILDGGDTILADDAFLDGRVRAYAPPLLGPSVPRG